ncbi:MAG: hypothetical protein IPO99_20425 [Nitrospira sp.]|nr:hypothetical protein [Nitrospira sp.]
MLKTRGHTETVETWTCRVITQDPEAMGDGTRLQRGDLVMTLIGSNGQGLFVPSFKKARRITCLAWSEEACYYRQVGHAPGT